jgi:hypothetical protein
LLCRDEFYILEHFNWVSLDVAIIYHFFIFSGNITQNEETIMTVMNTPETYAIEETTRPPRDKYVLASGKIGKTPYAFFINNDNGRVYCIDNTGLKVDNPGMDGLTIQKYYTIFIWKKLAIKSDIWWLTFKFIANILRKCI